MSMESRPWERSVDEARAFARERFRERLQNGEQIGNCDCSADETSASGQQGETERIVGVRFRDSSRVYLYLAGGNELAMNQWIVVPSSRGIEPARVVIAPKDLLVSQVEGELRSIERVMNDDDVALMEELRARAASTLRLAVQTAREHDWPIKIIAAEYAFDGSRLKLSYSSRDHTHIHDLSRVLEPQVNAKVDMAHVGDRDEARLIGGLGKCGRTLCCSSWLPYYPDVTMGMAKNQDLSLNPSKVSGLCGRLLCCLSYENEQYRQAKRLLPRLGQSISTPMGEAMVISLQVLKQMVNVRLADTNRVQSFAMATLLEETSRPEPSSHRSEERVSDADDDGSYESSHRRRRRRGRRSGDGGSSEEA